jgi:prevent-host-death family protein
MREVPLAKMKDDLSRYLRLAADQEILITRHGRPAGLLIGFRDEEAWLDHRLENDSAFLDRIADARAALRQGRGIPLDEI